MPSSAEEPCAIANLKSTDTYSDLNKILDCINKRIEHLEGKNSTETLSKSSSQFIAGTYTAPPLPYKYIVDGPEPIAPGREMWSIVAEKGWFEATWYTGSAAGNPVIGSRKIADKLPSYISYGLVGNRTSNMLSDYYENRIVGFKPTGKKLIMFRFHKDKNTDSETQQSTETFHLVENGE